MIPRLESRLILPLQWVTTELYLSGALVMIWRKAGVGMTLSKKDVAGFVLNRGMPRVRLSPCSKKRKPK